MFDFENDFIVVFQRSRKRGGSNVIKMILNKVFKRVHTFNITIIVVIKDTCDYEQKIMTIFIFIFIFILINKN
jgi:hypothetical protein